MNPGDLCENERLTRSRGECGHVGIPSDQARSLAIWRVKVQAVEGSGPIRARPGDFAIDVERWGHLLIGARAERDERRKRTSRQSRPHGDSKSNAVRSPGPARARDVRT